MRETIQDKDASVVMDSPHTAEISLIIHVVNGFILSSTHHYKLAYSPLALSQSLHLTNIYIQKRIQDPSPVRATHIIKK